MMVSFPKLERSNTVNKEATVHNQEALATLREIRDIFEAITTETAMANQLMDGLENILLRNSTTVDYANEDAIHFFQKIMGRAKAIKRWLHDLEEASSDVLNEIAYEEDIALTAEGTQPLQAQEDLVL